MLDTVAGLGFEQTTPIQTGAIPPALLGSDVIGQAHTGSGKTAAFGIPMVERLDPDSDTLQALVLCPTRELAVQVHDDLARLSAGRLRALAIYGGDSMSRQLDGMRRHPHIVVATPGRLRDHLQRRSISLGGIRIAVLDEADRMLDMGFAPDVEAILRECPKQRQTLLFSATMPDWVRRIAGRHMHEPVTVEVSTRPEIPGEVRQLFVRCNWADKVDTLARILDQPDVTMALIFVETKRTADLLQVQIERRGYTVGVLHGDLTQKERDEAMRRFVTTHVRSLIATNVAARGLDIDDISHVINYDVPGTPDDYLHRVGRTGRAGRPGVAITLITPAEILKLRDVERHARTHIEEATLDVDFPLQPISNSA
jgi:ATP-dependent RNA helicase DeaD